YRSGVRVAPGRPPALAPECLLTWNLGGFFVQHRDVRQVSVPLSVVQPVADDEAIRDLETDVANGDVGLPAPLLDEESAHFQRHRLACAEVAYEVGEREARVDDVLQDEDVAVADV